MTAERVSDAGGRERGIYTVWAFISSSLSELAVERQALDQGLTAVSPHFYDHEHGAALESHQQEWRHDLTRCDLYIGIYWKKLGPWTLDEFQEAKKQHKPMLLYFKGPFEWEGRGEELRSFIASLGDVDRQGAAFFEDDPAAFARLVNADLEREKLKAFAESIERRQQVHAPDTGLTYTPTPDGGRADQAAGPPPGAVRRATVSTLEPFDGEFLDREDLREELIDALDEDADEELIELIGPKGMGRGSVLERLVMEDLGKYSDGLGVNPVGATLDDLDDLLRTVFDAFYESSEPEVVTAWSPETLRAHLAGTHDGTSQIRALVVFEDVPAESGQFAELRAALPKSLAVCVTSEGETGEGLDVPVEGFEDAADVLALFEQRYKAPVPEKAQEFVLAACALLGNAPGAIRELGRLASREAKPVPGLEPLVAWARAKAESPPGKVLERGGAAKDAVKALIAAGGEAPAEVVGAVAGADGAGAALADGLIEPGSPRYRLGSVVTHDVAGAADDVVLMGAILDSAVVWAEGARLDEIRDDRAFVQRMAAWGLTHGRYEEVLRLAVAAEPALAMGVRWGAWEQVLEAGLAASRALNRPCSEAWAKHQLGTRALLLGDLEGARRRLTDALELRLAYCSAAAADLTRHNLALAGAPPLRPLPLLRRIVPGLLAAIAALLLIGSAGPSGGIPDFDVDFGAVQVGPGMERLTLFRLAPEEYGNDRAMPTQITIALEGDPEFCLAVAGVGTEEGACVEAVAAGDAAPRAPPAALPTPGMPLAQAGAGCDLAAMPSEFLLTIGPGSACPVLFGFDPPDVAGLDLAAEVTFTTARGGRWRGRLAGSTFEGEPVIDVVKLVDADRDGAFATVEQHPDQGGDAVFEVTVANLRPGSAVTLLELVDNRYGDVTMLEGTNCEMGLPIPPGGSYTCRYSGPVLPGVGGEFTDVVTATVDLVDVTYSSASTATVTFADPDAAVRVTKQVDADGDGAFARSERYPGIDPGPVEFEVTVENRSGADLTIESLLDDRYGDLAALPVTSCGTGVELAPGGRYECRFSGVVDPGAGAAHRNTVAVAVDPPLDGPYTAQAVVTFGEAVEVTKTVDANGDGAFAASERFPGIDPGTVDFALAVENRSGADVTIASLRDDVYGDLGELAVTSCGTGVVVPPGGLYECRFTGDIDPGDGTAHRNTVAVVVDPPLDGPYTAQAEVTFGEAVEVTKTVDADGDGDFGPSEVAAGGVEEVVFRLEMRNVGSFPVEVAAIDDTVFGDVAALAGSTCAAGATIAAGDAYECEFPASVDVEDTEHRNVVTVTLDTPFGERPVESNPAIVFPPPQGPDELPAATLLVDPEAAPEGTESELTYEIRVEQPVGAVLRLGEVRVSPFGDVSGLGDCVPGTVVESCGFSVRRVGGDAGDTFTAVLDTEALIGEEGGSAATVTFTDVVPRLRATGATTGPASAARGDRVRISLAVRNDSVATDPVTLSPGPACTRRTLPPGARATCAFDATITAAPGTTQSIVVTVQGADDEGNPAEASATHTVAVRRAGLDVDKALEGHSDADGSGTVTAGDTLTFRYTVLNTGDEPLSSVTVTDSAIGQVAGCAATLPPGGLTSCTGDRVVTAADAAAGQAVAVATATATAASGAVSASDTCTVPVAAPPDPTPPELVVEVRTVPHTGLAFEFGGAFAGTLRPGEQAVRQLSAGTHQVTLAGVPDLWRLDAVDCDPGGTGDVAGRRATYQLVPGARVRCVFRVVGDAPIVDIDRELIWFSPQPVDAGPSVEVVTVIVTNVGTAPASLSPRVVLDTTTQNGVAVPLGSASPHFRVANDGCPAGPDRLGPGDDCAFQVVFDPGLAPGTRIGIVQVNPGGQGDSDVVVIGLGS